MRRTVLILWVAALVLASCGGDAEEDQHAGATTPSASATVTASDAPTPSRPPELRTDFDLPAYEDLVAMYDYDTSKPLSYEILGEAHEGGATEFEIAFRGSAGTVPGTLVIPDGPGPFPVVVYAPGFQVGTDFFTNDALALAEEGYAGLLVENPSTYRMLACFFCWDARRDVKGHVQYAIDLRRAIDLLETLPEIDSGRVGFVGHSLGGIVGGILSGVEDRIGAYVLMDGTGYVTQSPVLFPGVDSPRDEALVRYQDGIAVINPVNYVAHNRGSTFLFQVSDLVDMPGEALTPLFDAAPEPKTLEGYESGHEFDCTLFRDCDPSLSAFVDHRAWLQENV